MSKKSSRWKQYQPYIQSMKAPFKAIWADPLGRPGSILFLLVLFVAIFAPLLATHDPHEMNQRVEGTAATFIEGQWERMRVIGDTPLNATAVISPGESFAVGREGTILHFDGNRWNKEESPVDTSLLSVDFFSSEFGFAVGENGVIIKYDGHSWTQLESPVEVSLNGVAVPAPDKAIAVGEDGTIISWDGNSWNLLDSPATRDLMAINMVSPNSGVIVGDRGTIIHYQDGEFVNASFRTFTDGTFRRLNAVAISDEGFGFTTGERGEILGFDGEDWYNMTSPESRELTGVGIVGPEEAYIVGIRGIVLKFDGERWTRLGLGYHRSFRGLDIEDGYGFGVGTDPYINELSPPTWEHLFGTTHLGRDIWSQVMYGSRTALIVGIITALIVNIIGVAIGLTSGYFRGRVDNILMRIVDIMYGLPLEPFAIILVLIFRPSLWIIILAIGLLTWRTNARIIRSQVLSLVERPFIKAARVAGASDLRIILVHIAPNVLPLAFLQLAVAIGYAITAEATLSFLGLGPPRLYSWGTILHAARLSGAWRTAWWWVIPPGIFISLTVVSVFLISRSLEVLTNPRLRGGSTRAPRSKKS